MNRLFIDTSGWMMLLNGEETYHEEARATRDTWLSSGGILLTTNYVVDETLTLVRVRLDLDAAESWWNDVTASRRVVVEEIGVLRAARARQDWLFKYRDKGFSFTDCTSFVVMRELRIKNALTTDHHFQQAGFTRLPDQD